MELGKNVDFWRDMTTIVEDELTNLRKIDPDASGKEGEGFVFIMWECFVFLTQGEFCKFL